MNEDFLENENIDGDVGGYLQRIKRQRRQPNPSGAGCPLRNLKPCLLQAVVRPLGAGGHPWVLCPMRPPAACRLPPAACRYLARGLGPRRRGPAGRWPLV